VIARGVAATVAAAVLLSVAMTGGYAAAFARDCDGRISVEGGTMWCRH